MMGGVIPPARFEASERSFGEARRRDGGPATPPFIGAAEKGETR